ncbi:hypothetical protein E0Z10_g2668 [Xylaria hypoxylon]|uniref:Uncharacterized protein n=1 Tax=Xylaria hypoxylon TaxID=37992 RepID=A0A4Z0Z3A5_9PEZI|nr:hypothetical protein E0Z10_g2668 [Xylaria hypoxylon]
MALDTSPIEPNTIKRPIEQGGDQETPGSTKKRRFSNAVAEPLSPRNETPLQKEVDDTPGPRSTSPEDLSVFDNSTIENSQITVISEPDVEITAVPAAAENRPRQGSMTREEARQVSASSDSDRRTPREVTGPALTRQIPKTDPIHRLVTTITSYITTARSSSVTKGRGEKIKLTSKNRKGIFPSCIASGAVAEEKRIKQLCFLCTVLNTPRAGRDDNKPSDTERGGAAEGLLSLSQSSPASALK